MNRGNFFEPLYATFDVFASAYHVDRSRIMEEFHRFLTIKTLLKDVDDGVCSPTPLINEIWHAALLNTKFYDQIEERYGMRINHNPKFHAPDTAEYPQRLKVFKSMYNGFFHEEPLEKEEGAPRSKVSLETSVNSSPSANLNPNSSASMNPSMNPNPTPTTAAISNFEITVKSMTTGQFDSYEVDSETTTSDLMHMINDKTGIHWEQLRLFSKGKQLTNHDQTLSDCGLREGDIVVYALQLRGC